MARISQPVDNPRPALAGGRTDGWRHWWPLLLGPAAMGFVYLAYFFPETGLCDGKACRDGYLSKSRLENAGVVLIAIVLGANAVRYYVRRNPVHLVFGALALAFVCREVHFTGTSSGVYVALVLIGAWVFLWRRKLAPSLFVRTFRVWLGSTAVTYVLSQLIARRVFRKLNLPYEDAVNVPLEELVENVAHVMFLVTSLIGVSVRSGRK